jgi:hypothetical protein
MLPVGNVGEWPPEIRRRCPRAIALLDRATDTTCTTGSSRLAVIDPGRAAPSCAPSTCPLRRAIWRCRGWPTAVVATCSGQLRAIAVADEVHGGPGATQLTGAGAVAVFDDRVWGVGALPPGDGKTRRLLLVSIALDGTGETRLELPPAQERAQSTDFSSDGQYAEQRMDADTLDAYDLALVPGADEVAILTTAYYQAGAVGDFLGAPIIPAMC